MLKRPFSIVRQYFCQMLDNTLAKRWAILLLTIEQHLVKTLLPKNFNQFYFRATSFIIDGHI